MVHWVKVKNTIPYAKTLMMSSEIQAKYLIVCIVHSISYSMTKTPHFVKGGLGGDYIQMLKNPPKSPFMKGGLR